ncbi:hypothetical protein H4R23_003439 [Coemansia sp. Cherry 401B]|nr:hypothetical protein IWW54_004036 [Coemansia sp. RSA 2705]KAJ2319951.1 hypothetical protein IWW52_001669 [Coemansia sp. RSA 2704]KAJ2729706.1 hypothetical protein H4R23_003439 [Coemansia sp. Cherry 401B]
MKLFSTLATFACVELAGLGLRAVHATPVFEFSSSLQPTSTSGASSSLPTPTNQGAEYLAILHQSSKVPSLLKDKIPDGMSIWFDFAKTFAVGLKAVCDSGPLQHSGTLLPSWPLIFTAGNSMKDQCGKFSGKDYSMNDAMLLFTGYAENITKAQKILITNQANVTDAYSYTKSLLKQNFLSQDVVCNTDYRYIGMASCGGNYAIILADDTWSMV